MANVYERILDRVIESGRLVGINEELEAELIAEVTYEATEMGLVGHEVEEAVAYALSELAS